MHITEVFNDIPASRLEEAHAKVRTKRMSADRVKKDTPCIDRPESSSQETNSDSTPQSRYQPAPSIVDAMSALEDVKNLLHPRRKNGIGHLPFKNGDILRDRMAQMKRFLYHYTTGMDTWINASFAVVKPDIAADQSGKYAAEQLRKWTRSFIADRHTLPYSRSGSCDISLINKFPELKSELNLHLQSIGKYVHALDIVEFLEDPEVQLRYGLEKGISLSTAQLWMHQLDYQWTKAPKGQFVDGYKRADVVDYQNKIFLPMLEQVNSRLRLWSKEGTEVPIPNWMEPNPWPR